MRVILVAKPAKAFTITSSMRTDWDKLYKAMSRYADFTEAEWQDISEHWEPVSFKKGEHISVPGVVERYMYFVVDGAVRIYHLKDDVDVTVAFSYTGHFAGEANSFVSRKPGVFYVLAESDCHMLRLSYEQSQKLYDKYKAMERYGRRFMEDLMVGRNLRNVEMLAHTAEERYLRMWQQSPHCFQLFAQKHLASYLGMTPETFSRIKRKHTPGIS